MKKMMFVLIVLCSVANLWSQDKKEDRNFRIPLLGEQAPSFTAESTSGTINFPGDYGRRWKVLFSHPQDFTPVCSSEILELTNLQNEFEKIKTQLVVVSTDALATHQDWKKALEQINFKDRGTKQIKFPLVADANLSVAKLYGMIHSQTNSTKDVRGVFIIDPDNVLRAMFFYPLNVGRNTEEIVRTISALQTADEMHVSTPADWKYGDDVLVRYLNADDAKKLAENKAEGIYKVSWFMTYKKMGNISEAGSGDNK
jgi:peroxiredoxin (alkyl hydroperoxide reductase subunit C)